MAFVTFTCGNQASVLQDFTADAELLYAAVSRLGDRVTSCQGGSSFTSAMYAAVRNLSWRETSSSSNSVNLIAASEPADGFYSNEDLWHLLLSKHVDFNLFWFGNEEAPTGLVSLTEETGGKFHGTVDGDTALIQIAEQMESLIFMPRALIEVPSFGVIGKPIVVGECHALSPGPFGVILD